MKNVRLSRRQLEGAAVDLDIDINDWLVDGGDDAIELPVFDELAGSLDLLAEFDYDLHDLAEFDFTPYELAESEPVELAPVLSLAARGVVLSEGEAA